ncbi:MAG TPA: tetratricopeptide repeat protein, partial [Capsulimonadaceae bacterium]|nr:tetratricopeptide repeat protein [Capsulimonadaceae bacterium]
MKTRISLFLVLLIGTLASSPVLASPLSDGYQAYHNSQYQTAIQDFQQAASQSTGVGQAKAYYGEGLTYRRMHDFGSAVTALQKAHQADPTDSFASSEAEYQRMLREAQNNYVGPMNGRASAPRPTATGVGVGVAPQQPVGTTVSQAHASDILSLILLAVIVVVVVMLLAANRRKKAQLAGMRGPIDNLRQNVLANIEYIDNYADVLPKNNADTDQVKAFRQAAAAKYEQADKILGRATEVNDLNRAQSLLDRANADTDQARRYLDRATGGTGNIPGDDAIRPVPLPV